MTSVRSTVQWTGDLIKWAFDSMSPFKSPGVNGIFPALLQIAITSLLIPTGCIYWASLSLDYIPTARRDTMVALIWVAFIPTL